jgi:lipoprotein-releasing system permease protein
MRASSFPAFVVSRLRSGDSDSFTKVIIRFAIGTIALCIAVILLSHALIYGFKEEIKAKVFGFWGHIQITGININQTFESPPISLDQPFYPWLDTVGPVAYSTTNRWGQQRRGYTTGGIHRIQIYALKPGILTRRDALEGILLKGIGADFDWDFMSGYLQVGRPLRIDDTQADREIWISRTTADRMRLDVDDQIIVNFIQDDRQTERRFTVAGIYKTGLEEYDRKFALVDIRHLRELSGWRDDLITGFEVYVDHLEDMDILSDYIYYEHLPPNLYSETIRQKFPAIFDWVEIQNINEQVLLILMLVVALINLITVLMILMLERVNMVGILKALGTPERDIRWIFVRLTLRILLWGLLWGNLLALGLGIFQQRTGVFKLDEAEYYLDVVPVRWDPFFFLWINALIVVVAILALWLPSLYIRHIHPVSAIRFK